MAFAVEASLLRPFRSLLFRCGLLIPCSCFHANHWSVFAGHLIWTDIAMSSGSSVGRLGSTEVCLLWTSSPCSPFEKKLRLLEFVRVNPNYRRLWRVTRYGRSTESRSLLHIVGSRSCFCTWSILASNLHIYFNLSGEVGSSLLDDK